MLVIRTIVALALLCLPLCGCSDEPQEPTCAACQEEYTSCSFPNLQESLEFQIQSRDALGCSGVVQGASVRLECDPLRFCVDSAATCYSATYSEGVLHFGEGNACG